MQQWILNRQFCDRLLRKRAWPPIGLWERKRRRSAKTQTPPGRQLRQRVSATTTDDAAPFGPQNQTEMQTTMVEKTLNLMERTRAIYIYEVCITNRNSTEATSMVPGTHPCQQLCKGDSPFSSKTYMAERPNLECVYALVAFFPLSRSGSCQTTCTWLLIMALSTR